MARVPLIQQETVSDPDILQIFDWVTEMEGAVPNHFLAELNFPAFMKAKLGATKVLWEQGEMSMEDIQHVGILVSRANGCMYCTGAFCTILNHGLNASETYVNELVDQGVSRVESERLQKVLGFALKVNDDAKSVTDEDIEVLKALGFSNKGIVQLVHLVSDFAAYNRLNLALATDYDYQPFGGNNL